MTSEKAINMLNGIRADNLNLDDAYTKDKYEALGMAIKALEQEPCDDCVSRQAVLKMAYDMSEIDGEHFTEPCMVVNVEDIQALPPIQPKAKVGHWIKMPLVEAGQTYSHMCSLCGRRILVTNIGLLEFPYCHCGAKMMEVEEYGTRI